MKKGKKIGLSLNKKVISNFTASKLSGGSSEARSRYDDCQNGGGGTYDSHDGSFCLCK